MGQDDSQDSHVFSLRNVSQSPNFAPVKRGSEGPNDGYGAGYALLTVSITFALTVVLGILGGRWLDGRLNSAPLFTLVGLLAGIGLGGFWAYLRIKQESGGNGSHRK